MYYQIAEIVLHSREELSTLSGFRCKAAVPDVTLERTDDIPPDGREVSSGSFVHRRLDGGWFYHMPYSDKTGLIVSDDYSQLRLIGEDDSSVTEMEQWLIRVALECLLIHRGYVSLHSACVMLDGEAVAFTGPSGTGKSTRAVAWIEALGAEMVSGDRPLIKVNGPEAYGVPWDGKERCFRNVHYPLKAIYDVRRSKSNYVRKMSFKQRRKLLMNQCFLPMWDTETAAIQMMNIARMASDAEILRTFCGPAREDAVALKNALERRDYMEEERDIEARDGFVLRNTVGEYLLVPNVDNNEKYNVKVLLNEVSSFIWKQLQTPVSRDDLLTAILNEYEVDETLAAKDLDELLERLRSLDLIETD